jgi:hypothetical protein
MLYLIYKKWFDLSCILVAKHFLLLTSWLLAQLIDHQMLLYKFTDLLRQLSVCTLSYNYSILESEEEYFDLNYCSLENKKK